MIGKINKNKFERKLIRQIQKLKQIFNKGEIDEDLLDEDELQIYKENIDTEILQEFLSQLDLMPKQIRLADLFYTYESIINSIPAQENYYEMDRVCWEDISIANNFLLIEKMVNHCIQA